MPVRARKCANCESVANPQGHAFWEREGFRVALDNRPVRLGQKDHLATRMVKPPG